jgi:hypothetical protein
VSLESALDVLWTVRRNATMNNRQSGCAMKPLMIVLTLLTFQSYPPPFPREGVTKLFENERVVVWTAAFLKNRPTPLHEHTMDGIGVFLSEGQLRNRMLDGTVREGKPFGNGHVVLAQRGVIHIEESLVEGTKAILIELKEAGPQTANLVATGSHATQLPSDQRLLLENARVRIVGRDASA